MVSIDGFHCWDRFFMRHSIPASSSLDASIPGITITDCPDFQLISPCRDESDASDHDEDEDGHLTIRRGFQRHLHRHFARLQEGNQSNVQVYWPLLMGNLLRACFYRIGANAFCHIPLVIAAFVELALVSLAGPSALASLTFATPIAATYRWVCTGIGFGHRQRVAAMVVRQDAALPTVVTWSLIFMGMFGLCSTGLCFATAKLILMAEGSTGGVRTDALELILIWSLSAMPAALHHIALNTVRGHGATVIPASIHTIGLTLSTVVGPVLMFGPGIVPECGLLGLGVGAIVGHTTSAVLAIIYLVAKLRVVRLPRGTLPAVARHALALLHVCWPHVLLSVVYPLLTVVLVAFISRTSGDPGVVGYGIALRFECVLVAFHSACNGVVFPFAAQHVAARRYRRLGRGLTLMVLFLITVTIGIWVVFATFSDTAIRLFTSDTASIHVGQAYLRIGMAGFGCQASVIVICSAIAGVGAAPFAVSLPALMTALQIALAIPVGWAFGVVPMFVAFMVVPTFCLAAATIGLFITLYSMLSTRSPTNSGTELSRDSSSDGFFYRDREARATSRRYLASIEIDLPYERDECTGEFGDDELPSGRVTEASDVTITFTGAGPDDGAG